MLPDELTLLAVTFSLVMTSCFIYLFVFFIRSIFFSQPVFFVQLQLVHLFGLLKFDDPFLRAGAKVKCRFC